MFKGKINRININTALFGLLFFFYFYNWASCFLFLPLWLKSQVGLDKTHIGIVYSSFSLAAICLQPFLGIITDKLGVKKNLVGILAICMIFFAPFFLHVYTPLLKSSLYTGIVVGAIYLSFIFHAGVGALEAFVEKVGRKTGFEYGHARLFGCFGSATCATIAGQLYAFNPESIFWIGSACAVCLTIALWIANTGGQESGEVAAPKATTPPKEKMSLWQLVRMRKFQMLALYVTGVACIYEVFDQQFVNFFAGFFADQGSATKAFGYITTAGNLGDAVIMFFIPALINKIGSKNALLIASGMMTIRIFGSAFAGSVEMVCALKMLHNLEYPFLLIGIFKYISDVFDVRLSATIYLIGFQWIKQVGTIFFSVIAGRMYDIYGFHQAYLFLGTVVLLFTLISAVTLQGRKKTQQLASA